MLRKSKWAILASITAAAVISVAALGQGISPPSTGMALDGSNSSAGALDAIATNAGQTGGLNTTDNPNFATVTTTGVMVAGGVFKGPDGAVGGPSYSFTNETSTGMYRTGASTLGLAVGGAVKLDYGITGANLWTFHNGQSNNYLIIQGTGSQLLVGVLGTTPFLQTNTNNAISFQKSGGSDAPITAAGGTFSGVLNGQADIQNNGKLAISHTAPTITAGGCTTGSAQSVSASNGTAAFEITLGGATCGTTITLGLPAASTGWVCHAHDITTPASNVVEQSTGDNTMSVVLTNYVRTTGVAGNFTGADKLAIGCTAY